MEPLIYQNTEAIFEQSFAEGHTVKQNILMR